MTTNFNQVNDSDLETFGFFQASTGELLVDFLINWSERKNSAAEALNLPVAFFINFSNPNQLIGVGYEPLQKETSLATWYFLYQDKMDTVIQHSNIKPLITSNLNRIAPNFEKRAFHLDICGQTEDLFLLEAYLKTEESLSSKATTYLPTSNKTNNLYIFSKEKTQIKKDRLKNTILKSYSP